MRLDLGASATLTRAVTAAFVAVIPLTGFAAEQKQRLYTVPVERAPTPKAWLDFCQHNAGACQPNKSGRSQISLTAQARDELVAINRTVNATIKPKTDQEHWQERDKWSYPDDGYGDCEDYALLKRRLLMEGGWPGGSLMLTVVWTEQDQGHAVLLVRTDKGGLVLDSQTSTILHWTQTRYQYVKRQRSRDPNEWVYIDGDSVPAKSIPAVAAQPWIHATSPLGRSSATGTGINEAMSPG